jgi:hypothetical protein
MKDSRIFMEWLDANGNKINIVKSAGTATTNNAKGDFTEKYKKLYTHIKNVWGGLNIMRCAMHELEIYYGDYYNRNQPWHHLIIRYIPSEGCFEVNISERGTGVLIYAGEADSWTELLDILLQTETIKNRKLCEWVDAKGNKITYCNNTTNSQATKTCSYREKFIKLLDYHMKHLPPTAFDPEIKVIQDDEFVYEEHHATGDIDYDYDLIVAVAVNTHSDDWDISVYKNGSLVKVDFGNGWEALLKSLRNNLSIPTEATQEYQKRLEWVDANGNKSRTGMSSTNSQQEEVVYIWDMYIDPRDKGTWCSAEKYNGEYDGSVFKTKEAAFREGKIHLMELEDEGELRGLPEDYDIDVIAIPKNKVSDYTLEFSGIK